jgi:hypothetical protein
MKSETNNPYTFDRTPWKGNKSFAKPLSTEVKMRRRIKT